MTASWLMPIVVLGVCSLSRAAPLEVVGTYWRADEALPQYEAFWREGSQAAIRLGGSLHVFLRNAGDRPLAVDDVLLADESLTRCIAASDQRKRKTFASIWYAKIDDDQRQRLIDHGEPVWWKIDPPDIAPGDVGEVVVRLRSKPAKAAVPLSIVTADGTMPATVRIIESAPRFAGISFAPKLDAVYLYLRHPAEPGTAPAKILLDGRDITTDCRIARDGRIALTPVVARLPSPMTSGSFHVFAAEYEDGTFATAGIRAWADEFAYGMFGGPGKSADPQIGKQYVDDLAAHNINIQMPQVGSPGAQEFFRSDEGHQYTADKGLRFILSDPGKFGIDKPYALYVHDEPDCGDYKAEGLREDKKIGAMAQWVVSRSGDLRKAAPTVPQMLNVNLTYKPYCWHTYGQIADIFATDPYYQVQLREAYWKHPERLPLYRRATFVSMAADAACSASEPRPTHVILYANSYIDEPSNRQFRFPTAEEKRIEVYYALAAGAKGLSYWWYTTDSPAHGIGGASQPGAQLRANELWREIGRLGAELRSAGPVLVKSCPIELQAHPSDGVWVRFLACGTDTLVMLAVTNDYENSDTGTRATPFDRATVTVTLPAWMQNAQAFRISPAGLTPLDTRCTGRDLTVPLNDGHIAQMVVITEDRSLRSSLNPIK